MQKSKDFPRETSPFTGFSVNFIFGKFPEKNYEILKLFRHETDLVGLRLPNFIGIQEISKPVRSKRFSQLW